MKQAKNNRTSTAEMRRFQLAGLAIALGLAVVASACFGPTVSTTPNSWGQYCDLVDAGQHCDYDASGTRYQALINDGAAVWNAYRPGVLRATTSASETDVVITDYNYPDGVAGYTAPQQKILQLNQYYLENKLYTQTHQRHTAYHELGHCLGLGENNNGLSTNVMRQGWLTNITLTVDDKASYDAAAKRY